MPSQGGCAKACVEGSEPFCHLSVLRVLASGNRGCCALQHGGRCSNVSRVSACRGLSFTGISG